MDSSVTIHKTYTYSSAPCFAKDPKSSPKTIPGFPYVADQRAQTFRHTDRQTDRHSDRKADSLTDIYTDKIDGQTNRPTERSIERY